jgi:ABC-type uncharacterized transport system substrate-binding protein
MWRVGLAVVFTLSLLAAPPAGGQQGERVYRIGLLSEGAHPLSKPIAEALRELGWIEGKNLQFERRSADRADQLPSLAAELVRLKVDLILANGTRATRATKEATKAIPIVFNLGEDPVANALVASLARPGGNLTGFVVGLYDEKALEVLKEALPALRRVAYPAPGGPGADEQRARAESSRDCTPRLERSAWRSRGCPCRGRATWTASLRPPVGRAPVQCWW